jgi:HPt (histidine-containing phosphotransfer) domain-containing protein
MQDLRIPAINILPVEVSAALDRGDRNSLPIDWKQLGQLSDGNEAFERELLGIFLTESRDRLQQAQQALFACDYEGLRSAAHQMKGASGNIGMHDFWEMAAKLERRAKQENLSGVDNILVEMMRSLTYVEIYLQEY